MTAAVAFFAADGVYREARRAPIVGRAAIASHWKAFFTGGPPWRIDVAEIFGNAANDRFALAYRFEMQRKDGVWDSRPGCALVKVAGELITEWREYGG